MQSSAQRTHAAVNASPAADGPVPPPQASRSSRAASAAAGFDPAEVAELRESKQELILKVQALKKVRAVLLCAGLHGARQPTGRREDAAAGGHAAAADACRVDRSEPSPAWPLSAAMQALPACMCRSWATGGGAWGSRWTALAPTSQTCRWEAAGGLRMVLGCVQGACSHACVCCRVPDACVCTRGAPSQGLLRLPVGALQLLRCLPLALDTSRYTPPNSRRLCMPYCRPC